jgi:hypothetical protein
MPVPQQSDRSPAHTLNAKLSRVPQIAQPVPDRYAGVSGQCLNVLLGEAAVLDAVIEAPEHPGCVRNGLLVPQL